MAQDIIITPRSGEPRISFTGSGTTASSINLNVLSDSTLSFEGTQGQLFSITNNLTSGVIFGVNDIGGLPLIEASANGNVSLVRYGNNVGIGTGSPSAKLDILETWNTSSVQTGIKLNVIDVSSNANSNLTDFQVSGSSKLQLRKDGTLFVDKLRFLNYTTLSYYFKGLSNGWSWYNNGIDALGFVNNTFFLHQDQTPEIAWVSDSSNLVKNLVLTREANDTLAQRRTTNPQTFRLYNTYTDASNYERASLGWNTSAFEIETEASGTGLARNLIIGTSGTPRIFVSSTGRTTIIGNTEPVLYVSSTSPTASSQFVFQTNGKLLVGDGTFGEKIRFNNNYSIETFGGGGIRIKGGAYVTISDALTYESAHFSPGYFGAPSLSIRSKFETQTLLRLEQQSWSTQTADYLQIAKLQSGYTTSILTVASSGWMGLGVSAPLAPLHVFASSFPLVKVQHSGNTVNSGWDFMVGNPGNYDGWFMIARSGQSVPGDFALDTGGNARVANAIYIKGTPLTSDANNILAQRLGTTSQTFRIYNIYTDDSNYERAALNWNASAFEIETEASGTGLARNLIIGTSGIPRIFVSSTGQIGIGNQTPTTTLDLSGGAPSITLRNPFGDTVYVQNNGGARNGSVGLGTSRNVYGNAWMQSYVDTTWDVITNSTLGAIRVQNRSMFLGGVVTPSATLHVSGNAIITSGLTINAGGAGITGNITLGSNNSITGGGTRLPILIGSTGVATFKFQSGVTTPGITLPITGSLKWANTGDINNTEDTYLFRHSAGTVSATSALITDSISAVNLTVGLPNFRSSKFILNRLTTDSTPSSLTLDGGVPTTSNMLVIPSNTTWFTEIKIAARQVSGVNHAAYQRKCLIQRTDNTTTLVSGVDIIGTDYETNSAWDVSVSIDDTNDYLKVDVTGAATTNIRWVAEVNVLEVGYGNS